MTKITKMFTEGDLLSPEFATSEQAHMTRYLSMLKKNIWQFVSNQRYGTHAELQDATRRQDIEMVIHTTK